MSVDVNLLSVGIALVYTAIAVFLSYGYGWATGYTRGRREGEATTLRRVSMALEREVVGGTGPTEAPKV